MNLSFSAALTTMHFIIGLYTRRIHQYGRVQFLPFFETLKCDFGYFFKKGIHGVRSPKRHIPCCVVSATQHIGLYSFCIHCTELIKIQAFYYLFFAIISE